MRSEPTKSFVVLSADDDENAHLLLRMAFNRSGMNARLITVNGGVETVRYLAGEQEFSDRTRNPLPDLVLLDLKMPRLSGFEVLEYIRRHPKFQKLPVIVFSSSDNAEDVRKAYAAGCNSYVVKPADFQKLLQFAKSIGTEFFGGVKKDNTEPAASSFSGFAVMQTAPSQPPTPTTNTARPIESPAIFQLLVEQVKDYAIIIVDRDGTVRSWNEGARRIQGYEAPEIIGKHFSVLYSAPDIESEKPQFELRMATEMGRYEDEGWRIRKDGSRYWANVVIAPMKESDGKSAGFALVIRDLTQRKFQEENFQRLLDSEERFRLLVEQVKEYAIFMLDAKGIVASWNQGARRLKGYSADEIIGKHFSLFYTPEDIARDHPSKELAIAIREGRYEEEGWRVRKNGSHFWASVVITALWDKRGNLTGFAKVTRDLTEKKKEADALRHKSEELEAFAHTLSHDLRAPLRSILGFAEILTTDGTLSDQEKKDYIGRIFQSAQSMENLMRGVLEYSQLSLPPVMDEAIPLTEVLEETMRMFDRDIQNSNAEIEIRKPMPVLRGNRTLLIQIFSNLLANALKFVPENRAPRVIFSAAQKNGYCEIHVKDFGIGIPEKHRQSIFKMFNRGNATHVFDGNGIGLAIVKKATERLGGSISLSSQEGEGSEFVVRLPVVAQETEAVPSLP